MSSLTVRPALQADFGAIAGLTVAAYRGDGQTGPDHPYEAVLADVATRASAGRLLVCVSATEEVLGSVLFVQPGSRYSELAREGEAEFRMLAVSPQAQGQGVGELLVRECLRIAQDEGCKAVVICVRDFSMAAQRLYDRIGFVRVPTLDFEPLEGVLLLGLRYDF